MKNILIISFLLISSLPVFGQDFHWSDPVSKSTQDPISQTLVFEDSSIAVIRESKELENSFAFDIFDKTLFHLASGTVTLPVDKIQHISSVNNMIVAFGVNQNEFQDKDILIAFEISIEGETLKATELMTTKSYGGYHANFDISVSPNHKFIGVIGSEGYSKDVKELISASLFDNDWNKLYSKDIPLSLLSNKRRFNVLSVNNQGVSYMIKRERIKTGDQYYIHTISKSGQETSLNLHLKSRKIVDMRYELDKEGNIYLSGFYAPPYHSAYEGVYMKKINSAGSEEFSKEYLINANVIETFKSKKDIKNSGYSLDNFSIKSFKFLNNKNLVLIIEEHHKNKDKGSYEDVINGMVVFNFNEKGGFKFSAPIIIGQTDEIDKGYWSSHNLLEIEGSPLVYLNLIGEGAKKSKIATAEGAGLPQVFYSFSDAGSPQENEAIFNTTLSEYCLYSKFKNKTGLPISILESKDHNQYAIGILKSEDE